MHEMHYLCHNCGQSYAEHIASSLFSCPSGGGMCFELRPFVALVCIDDSNIILKYGEVYDGQWHRPTQKYILKNGDWFGDYRFIAYDPQWSSLVVKCINDEYVGGSLIKGNTYMVLGEDTSKKRYWLQDVPGDPFSKNRFEMIVLRGKKNYATDSDPEEAKLRDILTSISDPYSCPKCGAPKAACVGWH